MSTPTKAAEIIRDTFKDIDEWFSDEPDPQDGGSGMIQELRQRIKDAISLLADLDGGGQVVKHTATCTYKRQYAGAGYPCTCHPSTTAADAPPEAESRTPVDVVAMIDRLKMQVELCKFTDELGHELRMNAAYLDLITYKP